LAITLIKCRKILGTANNTPNGLIITPINTAVNNRTYTTLNNGKTPILDIIPSKLTSPKELITKGKIAILIAILIAKAPDKNFGHLIFFNANSIHGAKDIIEYIHINDNRKERENNITGLISKIIIPAKLKELIASYSHIKVLHIARVNGIKHALHTLGENEHK
jgi:hypothetical protein